MSVEITNEPQPIRVGSKVKCDLVVRLIDSKTGKQVGEGRSKEIKRNECQPREERKY